MTIRESNVTIMVKSMDASVSFYESIGLTLKNRWGEHYAQLTAPGVIIGLHPAKEDNSKGSGNISIGFTVDNFEEAGTLLKKLSIKTHSWEDKAGDYLHFTDLDGTILYFMRSKY